MDLLEITRKLTKDPLLDAFLAKKGSSVESLSPGSQAPLYSSLFLRTDGPLLIISQNAESLASDMSAYLGGGKDVLHFKPWDTFPTEDISPSKEIVGERLEILDRLLKGEKVAVICNVRAAATRVMPKQVFLDNRITVKKGGRSLLREDLLRSLVKIGYKRRDIVGERGEFSSRGSIVDIFPTNSGNPVRIEYISDEIESLRIFDSQTQRSVSSLGGITIFPVHEIIPGDASQYADGIEARIPGAYEGFSDIFDYIGERACVILDGMQTIRLSHEKFIKEVEELRGSFKGKYYLSFKELTDRTSDKMLITVGEGEVMATRFSPTPEFYGRLENLTDWAAQESGTRAVFIVSKQVERLYELMIEKGLSPHKMERAEKDLESGLFILFGELYQGFSTAELTVLSDKEIFAQPPRQKFTAKPSEGVSKDLLAELTLGNYVVHENYGIGLYRGLEKLAIGGAVQEYIQIDYADGDKLYVPLHQMGLVEKYSGGGDYHPKVGRLGGAEWARVKSKAKKSIKDMTEELMALYSARQHEEGFRYPKDSLLDADFEKSFQYEETPDQAKAISDLKREMEEGKLIDRLVCGDVGYGKTEVAIRAAFKTVLSGLQVAILTPTTVLADQHFRNFAGRFKPYPIAVEMLSRFRSRDDQQRVVRELEAGAVDIVIGTHRLLQKDVKFKNLGLLVVDEEQKFGVSAKEKLKTLAKGMNVITLTATPIPRTLYMALSGVREMSVISTPPLDRSPVRTYLRQFDKNVIKEALLRELERGGQVYFVHNYVKTIDASASLVKKLVPDARVAVAHGQMKESQLEEIMIKFINKEYDVLVSTSIIESGLDIPSVNTVIIDRAEDFGLSQLYQIRGRVGRSATRAFAYLLYHKERVLTDKALDRLKAIQEFTSLGSGYKLAMADLEIRGAGNILGAQQSGHLLNVGFDMYCSLLEESVMELKHIEAPPSKKMFIDLKIDAFIPASYVEDDKQRIALYKRMNFFNDTASLDEMRKEMIDRFGAIPDELNSLFRIIELKIDAANRGVVSITGGSDNVEVVFGSGKRLPIKTKGMPKKAWFKLVQDTVRKLGPK